MDDPNLVFDLLIHTAPKDRSRAIDRYGKRLIAQKMWISAAPKATLNAQVTQIKALLAEIETDIQDQLKRVK